MTEWISVKDRLPEFVKFDDVGNSWTGTVLAWGGKELYCGEFNHYIEYSQVEFIGMYIGEWDTCGYSVKVTHWMPLPEPPKGCDYETSKS